MKKRNIGSMFDSRLKDEGIYEEVTANALKRVTSRRNASATAQPGLAESQAAETYKSRAMAALHENVGDLYRAGMIDEKTMRKFDAACLTPARKPARTASK